MLGVLGIVAGQGDLPLQVIDACQAQNRPFFLLALEGQTPPNLVDGHPHTWVRLGAVGHAVDALRSAQVRDIVMVGGMTRPTFKELSLDFMGTKWLTTLGFKAFGDDGLLGGIVGLLEKEGFHVVGVHTIVRDLLTQKGTLGRHHPSTDQLTDIKRGWSVAKILGQVDVGQAAVVQNGLVLAVEGIEGTQALIERSVSLKRAGSKPILVKVSKPQQERRVDLPTVGPNTIDQLVAAGFGGIALEAGGTLMVHSTEVIAKADAAGLFVVGVCDGTF